MNKLQGIERVLSLFRLAIEGGRVPSTLALESWREMTRLEVGEQRTPYQVQCGVERFQLGKELVGVVGDGGFEGEERECV